MYYENGLFPNTLSKKECTGEEWLISSGFIKTISPGIIATLPMGVRVLKNIENIFREICERENFWEITLPALQEEKLWVKSGRINLYERNMCKTILSNKTYILNPTLEEAMLDIIGKTTFKKIDFPLSFFQISERFRDEYTPKDLLVRSKSFILADAYIFTTSQDSLMKGVAKLRKIIRKFCKRINTPIKKATHINDSSDIGIESYFVFAEDHKQFNVYKSRKNGLYYRFKSKNINRHIEDFESLGAIEIGDITIQKQAISSNMGITIPGEKNFVYMATLGIGISRLLQIIASKNFDNNGIIWPKNIAPFAVTIICNKERVDEANALSQKLSKLKMCNLVDKRNISIARKLIDFEMTGIPVSIILGNKTDEGQYEIKFRTSKNNIFCNNKNVAKFVNKPPKGLFFYENSVK
jgi:prolyl-tRNA synthetase